MTIAVGASVKVTNVNVSSAAPQSTGSITTSASGSTFVVMITVFQDAFSGQGITVTDSKSNTYADCGLGVVPNTNGAYNSIAFCTQNATGGASHTFTAHTTSTGSATIGIFAVEITGAAAASLDKVAGVNDASSPFNSGSTATTSQANELLIGFAGGGPSFNDGNTHTVNSSSTPTSGWGSAVLENTSDSTAPPRGAVFAQRVTSAGAYNFAFTVASGPSAAISFILTFNEAAAAGAAFIPRLVNQAVNRASTY